MRKLLPFLVWLGLPMAGFAVSGPVTLFNDAVAYSTNPYQNLQAYGSPQGAAGKLSAQVTWSSGTYATGSFTDGTQSTGSLTVVSTAALVATSATDSITVPSTAAILGSPATNQITVVSTTGLAGLVGSMVIIIRDNNGVVNSSPSITLNGQYLFTYGTNVTTGTSAANSATNLATAITASGSPFTAVVTASTGVTVACVSSGTFCNSYRIDSTSPTAVSSGTMSGGANPVTVTINNGAQTLAYTYGSNWASSNSVTGAATTFVTASSGIGGIVSSNVAGVVYASASLVGTFGNSYTITTSSASRVSVSSSSFLGGLNRALVNAYFTLNGQSYLNGTQWTDVSGTSTGTAASIAAFFNATSTNAAVAGGGLGNVRATATGGVVSLVTFTSSTLNNAITLATTPSSGGLTIGSALFTGGQSNASITINGTALTLGTDFAAPQVASTTANMATSIAAAINANSTLTAIITAAATSAVVVSTSKVVGTATNYTTVSSTQSQLSFANATMTGGTNSGYSITTDKITITGHGFTKALPVLYSSGTVAIGGLTNQTTYYIVVIDSNTVGVSSTSAVALTGNYIDLTSSATGTTAHTYTLAPLSFSQGPAAGKWQVSNDAANWNDYLVTSANISVSSQTFAAVNPSTNTVQDFGFVDYGYIRYNTTGPTQGAVNLKVILNAKD